MRRSPRRERGRGPCTWQTARLALALASAGGLSLVACEDEPEQAERRLEPMRELPPPPEGSAGASAATQGADAAASPSAGPGERPRADPEIERALTLIRTSGRRFWVPAEDPEEDATMYTAEQFASMLRKKWDWLGYDIVALDPWLNDIASRSFKSNLVYQVELEGGRLLPMRGWLERELARAQTDDAAGSPEDQP
ncbi:DUF5329 family protein [Pseudenhygromyxa sp. WMMC2535]|uniref:DUF5329 family protein n=1 Tax=Pseudenhygromyxa sp. WMMC2535 TaxID=2712867 RepID=UPI0015554C87|nr:DUF5329 family protein [Pseudenhygromyxa sp. WMMC2535]NVB43181.1 DUF5329 family protein [Pseudenhygromyxa sp. WMMC2535]